MVISENHRILKLILEKISTQKYPKSSKICYTIFLFSKHYAQTAAAQQLASTSSKTFEAGALDHIFEMAVLRHHKLLFRVFRLIAQKRTAPFTFY